MSAFGLRGSLRDRAHYEEIAGTLHGLLVRLDDRLPGKDITLIAEFIDASELGLALEQMPTCSPRTSSPLRPTNAPTFSPSWTGCRWVIGFLKRCRSVPRDDAASAHRG